jgi:PleD family two-component response regulator
MSLALLDEEFPKRILIVDDQSFNIEAVKIILKYHIGLDSKAYCEEALNGSDALSMIM